MIIRLDYPNGVINEDNVTQFDMRDGGIYVTYTDGTSAYFEDATVVAAWNDDETHKDYHSK